MNEQPLMNGTRSAAGCCCGGNAIVLVAGAAVLVLALAIRFGLMENETLAAQCALQADTLCMLRTIIPQIFIDQRIGWLALVAGLVGFATGRRRLAWTGWLAGLAGMQLYSVDYATVGALLALLALLRRPAGGGQQQAGEEPGDGLRV